MLSQKMKVDLRQTTHQEPHSKARSLPRLEQPEDFSIQQFLNEDAFVDNLSRKQENHSEEKQDNCGTCTINSECKSSDEPSTRARKKSLFHNFQKHLITILKKHFKIRAITFEGREEGALACLLWQAFSKTKSYNKKILHILFGIHETSLVEAQYQALAHQFKEFRLLNNKHNLFSIIQAQQLIREDVIQQSRFITKRLLEANCNASRLELLWEYFTSFIQELEEGPIAKRMSKEHKNKLLQNVYRECNSQ